MNQRMIASFVSNVLRPDRSLKSPFAAAVQVTNFAYTKYQAQLQMPHIKFLAALSLMSPKNRRPQPQRTIMILRLKISTSPDGTVGVVGMVILPTVGLGIPHSFTAAPVVSTCAARHSGKLVKVLQSLSVWVIAKEAEP